MSSQSLQLLANEWYSFVININNEAKQLSLFIYNRAEQTGAINPAQTAELQLAFEQTNTVSESSLSNDHDWKLMACKLDFTNLRVWNTPIEQEQQELVLSQYVVKDTHLTEMLDNASPELLVPRVTNPR